MQSNIEVRFLSLEDMANASTIDWRYQNVGIDNLGFADPLKQKVFIRAGLEPEVTKYLLNHEIGHLFEMEGTDEDEFGIRHKKKNAFLKTVVPIVGAVLGSILMPGVGSMLGASGLSGLAGGILSGAVGQGVGAGLGGVAGSSLTGKPNWAGNAIGGLATGVGSAVGGLLGDLGTTTTPGGTITTSAGPGVYGGGTNAAGKAMRYGTPIFSSSIAGLGGKAAEGLTQTGLGMISGSAPSSGSGFNTPDWTGFNNDVPVPTSTFGRGFGLSASNAPSGWGETEGTDTSKYREIGAGQAGITLGGGAMNSDNINYDNMFKQPGFGSGMTF